MGSDNLAIVFAPTLMRCPEPDPMMSLMNAQFEQKALETMLVKFRDLFSRMSTTQNFEANAKRPSFDALRISDQTPHFDKVWDQHGMCLHCAWLVILYSYSKEMSI